MYSKIKSDDLRNAGDYTLGTVAVISKESFDGSSQAKKVDITSLIVELNIYEDIEEKNLTGQVVINDSTGLPTNFPLTGNELLSFKLGTPGSERYYDFEKHPMVIYKIGQRRVHNPRSQFYILYFCSMEQVTNQTVKVQRSFSGSIDNMISSVCQGELGTKKDIYIEKTRGNRKYVIPRWNPYKALTFLCSNAQAKDFKNTGYKFYESALGFHCRSYENMMAVGTDAARPANALYKQKMTGTGKDIISEMQTISSYEIIEQFNTMKLLATGALASRVLKTDLFNKTFTNTDFDYVKNYELLHHTESDGNGAKEATKLIVPEYPFRDDKKLSEYPDGTFYQVSDTAKTHEDFEHIGDEDKLSQRISQDACLDSFKIRINVPGYTGLSVGEMVSINLPKYEKTSEGDRDIDLIMSGRYLVSKIVHILKPGESYHAMSVECLKDSVKSPYYNTIVETEPSYHSRDKGKVYAQDKIDDGIFGIIS
jgi:hypothetical protein